VCLLFIRKIENQVVENLKNSSTLLNLDSLLNQN